MMSCDTVQFIPGWINIPICIDLERVTHITWENVHMNVESALTADIGEVGKKLHTGRSRNDQVLTALRLYLRDAALELQEPVREAAGMLLEELRSQRRVSAASSVLGRPEEAGFVC